MDNHIILLRVNQYLDHPNFPSRKGLYEGKPSWLDIRLDWMEKYTLNNLSTQNDMGFWCFMLCDPKTPESYKIRLKNYEKLGFVKILETNAVFGDEDLEETNNLILSTYKKVRTNQSDEIICSRLDTDDMVGPNWNNIVKQTLEANKRVSLETVMLYNFINKETKIINWDRGSFISTKSTLDNFDNPRSFQHGNSNAAQIQTDYPLVCMGIHDNNVTNHNWWGAGRSYPLDAEIFNQMFKIKR
tara:strand:- start:27 stop:755 length:729 start_codon:yes stop_codon:yes gene_type:complete